jgi:hypothetical protein
MSKLRKPKSAGSIRPVDLWTSLGQQINGPVTFVASYHFVMQQDIAFCSMTRSQRNYLGRQRSSATGCFNQINDVGRIMSVLDPAHTGQQNTDDHQIVSTC